VNVFENSGIGSTAMLGDAEPVAAGDALTSVGADELGDVVVSRLGVVGPPGPTERGWRRSTPAIATTAITANALPTGTSRFIVGYLHGTRTVRRCEIEGSAASTVSRTASGA
jgi:hypothetical protein